jgi:hypothetical protein
MLLDGGGDAACGWLRRLPLHTLEVEVTTKRRLVDHLDGGHSWEETPPPPSGRGMMER